MSDRKKQGRVTEERMQEIFSLLGIPDLNKATPEAWGRAAAMLDYELSFRNMFCKKRGNDPKNTLGHNAERPVNATLHE
jgi:hypothetical protein